MKNVFTIILALLYLVTSSGFTTYTHLCNGVKQQTGFAHLWKEQDNTCKHCGKNKSSQHNNGCCKLEYKVYKSDEKFDLSQSYNLQDKSAATALLYRIIKTALGLDLLNLPPKAFKHIAAVVPLTPLYVLFSVYRI